MSTNANGTQNANEKQSTLLSEEEIRRRYRELDVRHGDVQPETEKSSRGLLVHDPDEDGEAPHFPTHLPSLDEAVVGAGQEGLPREGVVVVGGNVGDGKTSLVLNLVERGIRPNGNNVVWVNTDQATDVVRRRAHAIHAQVPSAALVRGENYERDLAETAVDEYHQSEHGTFYINKKRFSSVDAIRQMAHVYSEAFEVDCFVFDTLQKFPRPRPDANEFETVKAAMHLLRDLADDLGVLCIGVSQYGTRGSRRGSSADMYHMRGGTVVAENADIVAYLDSERKWRSKDKTTGHHLLVVEKNRFGHPTELVLDWDWVHLRCDENREVSSWAELTDED